MLDDPEMRHEAYMGHMAKVPINARTKMTCSNAAMHTYLI